MPNTAPKKSKTIIRFVFFVILSIMSLSFFSISSSVEKDARRLESSLHENYFEYSYYDYAAENRKELQEQNRLLWMFRALSIVCGIGALYQLFSNHVDKVNERKAKLAFEDETLIS